MKKLICILMIIVLFFTGCLEDKNKRTYDNNIIETNIDFYRAHVNYINFVQNYMEVQTWDFNTIIINFLDNSLSYSNEKLDFDEGDYVVIINAKEDKYENGNIFYFADKDTIISRCTVITEENKTQFDDKYNYVEEEKPLVNEVIEEKNNNYNYGQE
ncbi:Hypothetical protein CM240_3086 [Clostridium bornimense]|uniref:Uncharacterized protein n=1 Tax=Clostridium bornimense TaxID=1216932 RepID=W6S0C9_9CLOT|nr:hypothetical protein [Clostridium bornimense]CDM70203.1 Hypothetical protein CM240_3086 [Clostridium bornimense]